MKPLQFLFSTLVLSILLISCDKNDSPPVIADQEFSIDENAPKGSLIGNIVASDNDEGQKLSFEILEGNENEIFDLDPSNGNLTVAKTENIDYEQTKQYVLSISVNDNHGKDPLESVAEITIKILNVNEIPQDGMEAYYNGNGNTNDLSGNNFHFNDPGLVYGTNRNNTENSTFSFTGSRGLTLPLPDFNNQSEPQSVSLWFKTASLNSVDYGGLMFGLLGIGEAGTGSRFMLSMKEGAIRGGYGDEWGDDNKWGENLESGVPLNDGNWHHVVFITNGDDQMAYLFIDNQVIESRKLVKSNNDKASSIVLKIGGDKALNYFTGEIDDLLLYQRALTPDEVEKIYVEK